MDPIKVLIAEDQEILRTGLMLMVASFRGMSVVGQADNGIECLELAQQLIPDLILMDLIMPQLNGIEATEQIKRILPSVKVVVFTSFSRGEDIFNAFAAGADAYCLKDADPTQLELAIKAAFSGALYMDPEVARRVFSIIAIKAAARTQTDTSNRHRGDALSARELEVLQLLVQGLSNSTIAKRLTISVETAKSHVRNIMMKLQVSDRTQAAVKAIREGLLPPAEP